MPAHHRSSRYGRFAGGPDPLAPPVDLSEALAAVSEDVMAGYSPEEAMREVFGLSATIVTDPVSGTPTIIPIGRHHCAPPSLVAAPVERAS